MPCTRPARCASAEHSPKTKFRRRHNGRGFTDRLFVNRQRQTSGNHEFERLCQQLGIKHRLTRPEIPQTNGMVERFNSAGDLEQTLLRYVHLYNHQLPQPALHSKTPMQAMKQ